MILIIFIGTNNIKINIKDGYISITSFSNIYFINLRKHKGASIKISKPPCKQTS